MWPARQRPPGAAGGDVAYHIVDGDGGNRALLATVRSGRSAYYAQTGHWRIPLYYAPNTGWYLVVAWDGSGRRYALYDSSVPCVGPEGGQGLTMMIGGN